MPTMLDLRTDSQLQLLQRFAALDATDYVDAMQRNKTRYKLENTSFGTSDTFTLHRMLRTFRPKKLIEIGCGMSSCVTLDTNERYLDNTLECTFIDPGINAMMPLFTEEDRTRHTFIASPLQRVATDMFEELQENDVLFIDSSHIYNEDSDVYDLLHRILPVLRPGVLIHFHDIFWNFKYPAVWKDRPWNEIEAVQKFLRENPQYEILFFPSYIAKFCMAALKEANHLGNASGGSLWLRKTAL